MTDWLIDSGVTNIYMYHDKSAFDLGTAGTPKWILGDKMGNGSVADILVH